ncbi:MAG: LysR family transcriptional regulator [Alteromonadaceae bacterium]|nr:LysR family transcriptional regulator [Alteromonadaceae bacterium]
MTLEQLRAFEAVVKHGSVRAASLHMHKSAPSISASIRAIEDTLAIELFSRESYRLVLTSEGNAFYDKARVALRSVTELNGFSKQKWRKPPSKFVITVSHFVSESHVVSFIGRLNKAFPTMQLNLMTETFVNIAEDVNAGATDIAIAPMSSAISSELEFKYLFSVERVAVASAHSSIAQLPQPINGAALLDETQLVLKDVEQHPQLAYKSIISGAKTFLVNDLKTQKSLIMAGVGWSWLPRHMVETELRNGEIVLLDIDGYSVDTIEHFLVRKLEGNHSVVSQRIWNDAQLLSPNAIDDASA